MIFNEQLDKDVDQPYYSMGTIVKVLLSSTMD